MSEHPTGFPIATDQFYGGAGVTPGGTAGTDKSLAELLNYLESWVAIRGIVDAPADLASVSNPEDGWIIAVRESAGVGTPPALYIYNADTTTWENLLSTGLPANHKTTHQSGGADEISIAGLAGKGADLQDPDLHATTHQHGGTDEIATDTSAANAIPKGKAGGALDASWGGSAGSLAQLDGSALVVQNPASAAAVPAPNAIVIAGALPQGEIDTWGCAPTGAVGVVWVGAAPTDIRTAIDRIAAAVAGLLAGPIP